MCLFSITTICANEMENTTLSEPMLVDNDSVGSENINIEEINSNANADSYASIQTEIYGDTNSGTFDDLQAEINNAPAGSILTLNRDYYGREDFKIQLNKDLTIDGGGHTLDCKHEEGCIAFYSNSGTITLKNLRIINGCNDGSSPAGDYSGGAIRIDDQAQYTIINCRFENNYADDYGGAISHMGSKTLTIKDCEFKSNMADDTNGGGNIF